MSPQTMPSETDLGARSAAEKAAQEEDARLRNDIRLLGRVLGDTVRDQEGADVFDLVERIRQTSVRFHRDEDKLARRELEGILDGMSIAETLQIVRASAISPTSPISPRTRTTSARCAAAAPAGRRDRARWSRR